MKHHWMALALPLALVSTGLQAQTLKGLQLDAAQTQTGQNVTATVMLDAGERTANCGLRVRWGDGTVTELRAEDAKQLPLKASHAYAKAGDYSVVADPGKVKSSLGCVGKKVTAMVKVSAPPPVAAAPAAVASAAKVAAGPVCPDNWKLDAKSVVKKTGAYSCTAKAGTALPDKRQTCPGSLSYFENAKKGMLGCRA